MKTKQQIQERIEQIKKSIQCILDNIDTNKMYSKEESEKLSSTIMNVRDEQSALEWVLKEE